ncbi:acylneuraminate cytidylyltransferase family protein [Gammaproteobacteria bacterium]|nr:acylneuraminate cytidylyltransferase family protein [Gammaproteobacteria bacterium]
MTRKVLSIIPARGGSKSLPRKNIIDFAGKPLLAWTIEASLNSKCITKTVVSSDDNEILNTSLEYGSEVIKRPSILATDTATSESVVEHVLDCLESKGEKFDIVILLQPTSPLRSSEDIDGAFNMMLDPGVTSVISVFEIDNKILKSLVENQDGFLQGISNNKSPFMRRQDLPSVYMPNGAIYISEVETFIKNHSFFSHKTKGFPMLERKSVDIDSLSDLELASNIFLNEKI